MTEPNYTIDELENEIWKDVSGYEGLYEVSNKGRVRRTIKRLLKPRKDRGYVRLHFSKDGNSKNVSVHQIVLKAFGPPQQPGQVVNHKNGRKQDNRIENLEWVTIAENIRHRDEVLGTGPQGTGNGQAILTEDDVREIRQLRREGMTCRSISLRYPVGRGAINHVVNRISWKHVD